MSLPRVLAQATRLDLYANVVSLKPGVSVYPDRGLAACMASMTRDELITVVLDLRAGKTPQRILRSRPFRADRRRA